MRKAALLAVCVFLPVGMAAAQEAIPGDIASGDIVPGDIAPDAPPPKALLWCSVTDAIGKRMFISDPVPVRAGGHLAIWNAGARFVAVVNARYTLTLRGGEHACHEVPDRTHAVKAQGAAETAARRKEEQVIVVGAY